MKSLIRGCLALTVAAAMPAIAQQSELPIQSPATEQVTEKTATFWLVLRFGNDSHSSTMQVIPTASKEQCEMSGAEFEASKRLYKYSGYSGFECLEGIR